MQQIQPKTFFVPVCFLHHLQNLFLTLVLYGVEVFVNGERESRSKAVRLTEATTIVPLSWTTTLVLKAH